MLRMHEYVPALFQSANKHPWTSTVSRETGERQAPRQLRSPHAASLSQPDSLLRLFPTVALFPTQFHYIKRGSEPPLCTSLANLQPSSSEWRRRSTLSPSLVGYKKHKTCRGTGPLEHSSSPSSPAHYGSFSDSDSHSERGRPSLCRWAYPGDWWL